MDEKYAVIKLAVEHSKLKVEREQFITSKSRQSIFIQINFRTNDWDNAQKTVIFNEEYIRTLDEENCCDIPVEAILEEGLLKIGVFGIDGDTRINTNQVCFKIFEGSYNEGIEPADITQSMYEQIMNAVNSKVSKTTTIAGIPLNKHITIGELQNAISDENHNFVTESEKRYWDSKSEFSGDYNDLINQPEIPSIEGLTTKKYVDDSVNTILSQDIPEQINAHNLSTNAHNDLFEQKVDKIDGKGLSTNDFTNEYKDKLNSALQEETDPTVPNWAKQPQKPVYTYDEIQGTPPEVDLSDYAKKQYVDDAIDAIPTPDVSGQINTHNISVDAHKSLFDEKVDKVEGKGLSSNDFTTLEKQKLESLKLINPVKKTEGMIQQVGIDEEGKLWTRYGTSSGGQQSDWDQEDEQELDFIKNKPKETTQDEIIRLLIETDMIAAIEDFDGKILADNDNKILIY